MSNTAVGQVYQNIIDEVVNSSRVDFEEGGVDEGVLEELRRGWQQKLTQLEVASFPWDPKPESVPAPAAGPQSSAPAQPAAPETSFSQAQLSPLPPPQGLSLPPMGGVSADSAIKTEPYIKQEPGTSNGQAPPTYQVPSAVNAAARAQANLAAAYGAKASSSIQAIAAGAQRPGVGQQQQGHGPAQQFRQNAAPGAPQQQRPQQAGQSSLGSAQMDGPSADLEEFEGVLMKRDVNGNPVELGRVDIDRLLHAQIAAKAKAMEGGGLMLPLKEATRVKARPSGREQHQQRGIAAFDGGDDDGFGDDTINSDLDDPNEEDDEDEVDDEGLGHIMLCMYDKVQRVKNKWKCILKDGVLTVNGKEYIFHKATGEYEW